MNIARLPIGLLAVVVLCTSAGCSLHHRRSNYREVHRQMLDTKNPHLNPNIVIAVDDLNRPNDAGKTPLHLAASRGQLEKVVGLLDRGARIDARDNGGATPLHLAAQEDHVEVAEALIEWRAPINSRDDEGRTPLRRAIQWKSEKTIPLLKKYGATE